MLTPQFRGVRAHVLVLSLSTLASLLVGCSGDDESIATDSGGSLSNAREAVNANPTSPSVLPTPGTNAIPGSTAPAVEPSSPGDGVGKPRADATADGANTEAPKVIEKPAEPSSSEAAGEPKSGADAKDSENP